MKYLILGSILTFLSGMSYAQGDLLVEVHAAADYITTPAFPRYQHYGYGNQMGARYGVAASIEVVERLRLGIGVDSYARKEEYDCVHFPDPEVVPQSNWTPIINNPSYSCDFSTKSRIGFVDFPVSISYDYIRKNTIDAFIKIGYGYQFLTSRRTTSADLQSGEQSNDRTPSFSLRSRSSFRISTGVLKEYSEKILLGLSVIYRSDSFQFDYQSIGLELGLNYRLLHRGNH